MAVTPPGSAATACGPPAGGLTGLPRRAGLGLKPQQVAEILASLPDTGFFEVHAENYMVDGGPLHHGLASIREHYALSLHGVGLSIGGDGPLDARTCIGWPRVSRYQPVSVSEHLAWSSHGGVYFNDLLPLPWTAATLHRVCAHIHQVQTCLKRTLLLENPATYVEFSNSTLSESQFLAEVVQRTGCGLLLDISNVQVSSVNHGRNAQAYLDGLPLHRVGQIHLAGFAQDRDGAGAPLLIDDHGAAVHDAVWRLFASVVASTGPLPTLIERDHNIPALAVLLAEAQHAEALLALALAPAVSDPCTRAGVTP